MNPDDLIGQLVGFIIGGDGRKIGSRGKKVRDTRPCGWRLGRVVTVYNLKRKGFQGLSVCLYNPATGDYDGTKYRIQPSELSGPNCGLYDPETDTFTPIQ
jgi:hypothetical protein